MQQKSTMMVLSISTSPSLELSLIILLRIVAMQQLNNTTTFPFVAYDHSSGGHFLGKQKHLSPPTDDFKLPERPKGSLNPTECQLATEKLRAQHLIKQGRY